MRSRVLATKTNKYLPFFFLFPADTDNPTDDHEED